MRCPRKRGLASRSFSPSPTSCDRPATTKKVFGARILSLGYGNALGYLKLANIWMILNVGGGPTPDKPTVTLSVPDPNHVKSFMNFRIADIQACYKLWNSRGAEFITEPMPKYGEIRCYIRDPGRSVALLQRHCRYHRPIDPPTWVWPDESSSTLPGFTHPRRHPNRRTAREGSIRCHTTIPGQR